MCLVYQLNRATTRLLEWMQLGDCSSRSEINCIQFLLKKETVPSRLVPVASFKNFSPVKLAWPVAQVTLSIQSIDWSNLSPPISRPSTSWGTAEHCWRRTGLVGFGGVKIQVESRQNITEAQDLFHGYLFVSPRLAREDYTLHTILNCYGLQASETYGSIIMKLGFEAISLQKFRSETGCNNIDARNPETATTTTM